MHPYQLGQFDYDECFLGPGGFLTPDANEEKHMMSFYLQELAAELARQGVVFGGPQPLHWLEPGIGDGSSTARFAHTLGRAHPAGFVIHGSDCQAELLPLARRVLEAVRTVPVTVAELRVVDAFRGAPLTTQRCDFALLSHFVYHAKNAFSGRQRTDSEIDEQVHALLARILDSLGPDGVALAFHESPQSDMFGKLGREFGAALHDATVRIAAAAHAHGKVLVAMPLESNLYFPDIPPHTLESFKELARWQEFSEATPEASWLKKFLFALHNLASPDETDNVRREGGARDLARQPSAGRNLSRLGDAIDRLCEILQRDGRGPYIVIRAEMQAILNSPNLKRPVEAAFVAIARRLPAIREQTRLALASAASNSAASV